MTNYSSQDEDDSSHRINVPEDIWELQDDNGKVVAIEVVSRGGDEFLIILVNTDKDNA